MVLWFLVSLGCFFDLFVASCCTCFRSFDLSLQPLWEFAGLAVVNASDSVWCLHQWGSCRETGNRTYFCQVYSDRTNKKTDISMQDKSFLQMLCIIFTVFMRCILIEPIVDLIFMHQGFASDQYHCYISVSGQFQWSEMLSSLGHNCSGTAITVLHSRLVSPSSCFFLPHTKLNCESCTSVWRP